MKQINEEQKLKQQITIDETQLSTLDNRVQPNCLLSDHQIELSRAIVNYK